MSTKRPPPPDAYKDAVQTSLKHLLDGGPTQRAARTFQDIVNANGPLLEQLVAQNFPREDIASAMSCLGIEVKVETLNTCLARYRRSGGTSPKPPAKISQPKASKATTQRSAAPGPGPSTQATDGAQQAEPRLPDKSRVSATTPSGPVASGSRQSHSAGPAMVETTTTTAAPGVPGRNSGGQQPVAGSRSWMERPS